MMKPKLPALLSVGEGGIIADWWIDLMCEHFLSGTSFWAHECKWIFSESCGSTDFSGILNAPPPVFALGAIAFILDALYVVCVFCVGFDFLVFGIKFAKVRAMPCLGRIGSGQQFKVANSGYFVISFGRLGNREVCNLLQKFGFDIFIFWYFYILIYFIYCISNFSSIGASFTASKGQEYVLVVFHQNTWRLE